MEDETMKAITNALTNFSSGDKSNSKGSGQSKLENSSWQNIDNSGIASDKNLKRKESIERLFADKDGAIDAFSKIDAYIYNYNDKAHQLYGDNGNRGIDNEAHFGPMAQDLAKNPVTEGSVHQDENGYLMVDTRQLTLTNTAMISQLARKIQELEERIGGRV